METFETIDPTSLGHALQLARKDRGLTQQQAADELHLARTTLVAIEKGERRLSANEFFRACKVYGRSAAEFLRARAGGEGFQAQFRSGSKEMAEDDPGRKAASAELERLARNYVRLEEITGARQAPRYPPVFPMGETTGGIDQGGEDLASLQRNMLGIGDGPVLNLRERLESDLGLRVFYFPMDRRLGGLYGYTEELGACVGINSDHPSERGRWTLAHELGHFLTTRFQGDFETVSVSRARSQAERFVDRFARCFLMPATGLNRRASELSRGIGGLTVVTVCSLANLYFVSFQAMTLRLEELGRVRAGTWETLSRRGFRPSDAQAALVERAQPPPSRPKEPRLPARFQALSVLAFERALVTEGELSQLLGLPDRLAVRAFVQEYRGNLVREVEGGFVELSDAQLDEEVGR